MMSRTTRDLGSETRTGLSEAAAAERLQNEGYNDLPTARYRGFLVIATEVLREPMFLLLITGVTLYQEHKTERALEKLRDLASPRALVVREERQRRIPGREVVRDDLLLLEEGDRVPADALVLSATNLSVDESLLTGESVPVRKTAADDSPLMQPPGGDDLPFVYSGTLVVHGHGLAQARQTGSRTALGRIGKALEAVEPE